MGFPSRRCSNIPCCFSLQEVSTTPKPQPPPLPGKAECIWVARRCGVPPKMATVSFWLPFKTIKQKGSQKSDMSMYPLSVSFSCSNPPFPLEKRLGVEPRVWLPESLACWFQWMKWVYSVRMCCKIGFTPSFKVVSLLATSDRFNGKHQ